MGPTAALVVPEQWHATLGFMGSAPDRVVEDLVERLAEVAARTTAHRLAASGGGCFPDVGRAKVLWAGLAGDVDELSALARRVRAVCSTVGAAPAGGPFIPHLTLGRFPRAEDATRWVRVLETYAGPSWDASEVSLVSSHLPRERGHRPRHEVLARLPLGG